MRMSGLIGVLLLGVLSGGCGYTSGQRVQEEVLVPMTAAWVDGDGLRVDTGNGRLELVRDDGLERATIEATLRSPSLERLEQAKLVAERVDGVLTVGVEWPGERGPREGAHFVIRSPEAFGITATTGNGAVRITGHSGPFNVRTSNGAIKLSVQDASGPTDAVLRTSNGRIDALGVGRDGAFEATTSNGRIEVALAPESVGPVSLLTSNGSVELEVGASFGGEISCVTSNGKIRLDGESVKFGSGNVRTATMRMTADGSSSSIVTSNGSIRVQTPQPAGTL